MGYVTPDPPPGVYSLLSPAARYAQERRQFNDEVRSLANRDTWFVWGLTLIFVVAVLVWHFSKGF